MLPARTFRYLCRQSRMCRSLGQGDFIPSGNINCFIRNTDVSGFLRISFLDIHKYRNLDVTSQLRMYADAKKQSIHLKTIKGRDLIQDVIYKNRESFIVRKNILVEDIREAKTKVRERVREKMEEVIERENVLTIPNLITVSRAFLAPYIGYVIIEGDFNVALGLLMLAGVSDMLDGQIARRWPKQSSKAGSFLDPMADKVLIGSLVVSMGYCDLLPLWLAGTILFRDVFLVGAGFVIRYISLPPPKTLSRYFDVAYVTAQLEPTFISKINTAVQLAAIGISLGAPVWHYLDHNVLHGLWYLTGATTVAAALSYVLSRNTYKIVKNSRITWKKDISP